jgi:glycosyltransferase involved in cell wall biosynthesis
MLSRPFLSVVIPVYNTAQYLSRCIESVLKQTAGVSWESGEAELILVNDGSTDKSGEICDDYARRFPNVTARHIKNSGQSVARNMGIEIARGEYVCFIDSDDWVEPELFAHIIPCLKKYAPDMLGIRSFLVGEDGKKEPREPKHCAPNELLPMDVFLRQAGHVGYEPWTEIYKRSFLLDSRLRFYPGIFGEDALFTACAECAGQNIIQLDYAGYNYFQSPLSTIRNPDYKHQLKRRRDLLFILGELIKLRDTIREAAPVKSESIQRRIDDLLVLLYWEIVSGKIPYSIAKIVHCELRRMGLPPPMSGRKSLQYSLYATLMQANAPFLVNYLTGRAFEWVKSVRSCLASRRTNPCPEKKP